MQNVSATGIKVFLTASHTFPAGFWVSAFADDKDPVATDNTAVHETAMGPNGDLVFWGTPQPIQVRLGVINGSEDDENLRIIYHANRVAKNKASVKDIVNMVIHYPDGRKVTCTNGVIVSGPALPSATASAKINGNEYGFAFENVI
ncbi:MAG: hypothetical protein IKA93_03255 [Elusimicrobiaceae bacterium]|nr:hypothetical protein [Elusimicrobiaceae bacterium]